MASAAAFSSCPCRRGVRAEQVGASLYLNTEVAAETPLSLAAEKAAQLHALLVASQEYDSDCGNVSDDDAPEAGIRTHLLSVATTLAGEVLALSELAAQDPARLR
ncbi:hypothetical protein BKK80_33795 [Cupriavidus malaysiensis]|uniref:DUF3077 domain-containing protein n=1 Tax=Cupriavidus malaysiensis TaxID=367825 RepID=A0ABM6FGI0_9BURK|nr:hypothetical protein BKK80_33795 [Cupriavidus malaysiensis]